MQFHTKYFTLIVCIVLAMNHTCFCLQFHLYDLNVKITTVLETVNGISLSQCAVYSEIQENMKAFNYNQDGQICEVSSQTPGPSLEASNGWKVYIPSGIFF
jgi:hypothetical protein